MGARVLAAVCVLSPPTISASWLRAALATEAATTPDTCVRRRGGVTRTHADVPGPECPGYEEQTVIVPSGEEVAFLTPPHAGAGAVVTTNCPKLHDGSCSIKCMPGIWQWRPEKDCANCKRRTVCGKMDEAAVKFGAPVGHVTFSLREAEWGSRVTKTCGDFSNDLEGSCVFKCDHSGSWSKDDSHCSCKIRPRLEGGCAAANRGIDFGGRVGTVRFRLRESEGKSLDVPCTGDGRRLSGTCRWDCRDGSWIFEEAACQCSLPNHCPALSTFVYTTVGGTEVVFKLEEMAPSHKVSVNCPRGGGSCDAVCGKDLEWHVPQKTCRCP